MRAIDINSGVSVGLVAAAMFVGIGFGPSVDTAYAAQCGNNGAGFKTWLNQFKKEARARGVSQKTLDRAIKKVSYDPRVIKLDRNQKSFKYSFAKFYKLRATGVARIGKKKLKQYKKTFDAVERKYGVPREVIASIWGLETGFGRNSGNMSVFRSLATLSYDCRRSAFFTNELYAALKIVQRGDMAPSTMKGAWAGEIGQTQFLASSYVKYAVNFDGRGGRDLIRSVPDVLGSTANYLKAYGWKRGQPWGPGTHNHEVLRDWNRAGVYVKTIAKLAEEMR